ncbi:MAG: [protein-PII] uridylyltransferase [Planctomycetes bacterium]|nr:[protein-PII] uridylyltransferase [Planctomycetota bacterium]
MTPRVLSLKKEIARIHEVALRRHLGGENPRHVVQGISDGVDALLRSVFSEDLLSVGKHVALVAVGGYGRRELCPFSDIDLLFLCDDLGRAGAVVERIVRNLWDGGLQLGHSVRTPEECLKYMRDDDTTAATLLESRFLAGSESLMRRFQDSLNRFRKLYKEKFARAKLECLRQSIEGPERTIFVTEPDIKEGICCLRDIQHILWIERVRRNVLDFSDIASHGGFSFQEVEKLEAAYRFYLRVRCELHFLNGLRQDILELDSQVDVARHLGYADDDEGRGIEKLMSDYYRHARNVHSFARYYLETKSRGNRFLTRLRYRVFSSRVSSFLSILDGRLYLSEEPADTATRLPERFLQIFEIAQKHDAELSQTLCEWIRRKLSEAQVDFSRSSDVDRTFLKILREGRNTGRILSAMHETGVLSRILPEFEKLSCLVTFDGHHQFTVDEHTLQAQRELDRMESDPNYPEPEFRKVLERIPDRLPLRVALLLHDIGKSVPGAHDSEGTEAAVVICERLGLSEERAAVVEFLIYRHLLMYQYSERMDFNDEKTIASFANLVGSRKNLDMLYLLTYIDIHSVGPGTWTAWKGVQLSELYQLTAIHLETGKLPTADVAANLDASGIQEEKRQAILEHTKLINNPAYQREIIPERMLRHIEMVEDFRKEGVPQVRYDQGVGFTQVTFCAQDRPHLFADLSGLLLSEGLNILGARIFSRSDGIALDLFHVEIADNLRVDINTRVASLQQKLRKIERGIARIDDLISDRARRYRFKPSRKPLFSPRVEVHDELSDAATVIEVHAGDRLGLLYDLACTIANLGLDLRTAKISTMIDRAHDVFYVVEAGGGKVKDPSRLKEIEEAIAEAARWQDPREARREEPVALQSKSKEDSQ